MPDLTLAEVVREIKSLRIPSDKFLRIQTDQVDWMKSWNEALGRALVLLARVEPAVPVSKLRELGGTYADFITGLEALIAEAEHGTD